MSSLTLAVTTASDRASALAFGRRLVEEGLAACATVVPGARSVYRWKGRIEEAAESVVLLKTTAARLPALRRRLRALHAYELPEDFALTAGAGAAYAAWVRESTTIRGSRKTLGYTRRK